MGRYSHSDGGYLDSVSDDEMCAKVAWVWPPGPYKKSFWLEEKRDSMQYTIEEVAKEHDVLLLAPVCEKPQRIGWKHFYINAREALAALRKFDPDVINLNLFGHPLNRRIAIEFTKSLITVYDHGGNLFCPYSKYVDVLFTNQEFRRKIIIQKNNISPEKVVLNPHGANTKLFYPDDNVEKTYTGIMVGDFRRGKQQHLIIENWNEVEGKLLLVGRTAPPLGEPDYTEECRVLIERLGLSERVEIKDFVPHDELPRIINSAEIGIHTSRGGAGGRSVTEIMTCGLPMIVLKNKCNEEWAKAGGLKEVDPNAIGVAVNYLKNNPAKYKELRETALRIIKPYSYDGMLSTFKKVIKSSETLID